MSKYSMGCGSSARIAAARVDHLSSSKFFSHCLKNIELHDLNFRKLGHNQRSTLSIATRILSPSSISRAKMEEYLHYMRTLRTQMNDVEDQAAKISVEEQMQITTIHSLEKDIASAKAETKKLMDETDQMAKARGHICSKILENQRRVSSLESDACTLSQTLELIQQERSNLSTKILEKSAYYSKVFEDMTSKLQEQQDWLDNKRQNEVTEARNMETDLIEEISSKDHPVASNLGDGDKGLLLKKLHSAKAKLDDVIHRKTKLVSENSEMKQTINELKSGIHDHKTELNSLDVIKLEEEREAVVSQKSGEMEYMQTLRSQVEKLKGISHVVKCACGEEYKVEVANV